MTIDEIERLKKECLDEATKYGTILVSPAISPGEKAIMRAAFEADVPLIILQENGFSELAKPGGRRFDACAAGRLLIIAPWEHHNDSRTISRIQCLNLNSMAQDIANEYSQKALV